MEKNMPLRYICRKCSFPGRVYIPRYQDVRGGVLVLHGSEGGGFGIHDRTAVLLACHGFTALAYDWCGSHERPVEGLPSKGAAVAAAARECPQQTGSDSWRLSWCRAGYDHSNTPTGWEDSGTSSSELLVRQRSHSAGILVEAE